MIPYTETRVGILFKVQVVPRSSRSEMWGSTMVRCVYGLQRRRLMARPMKSLCDCSRALFTYHEALLRSALGTQQGSRPCASPALSHLQ